MSTALAGAAGLIADQTYACSNEMTGIRLKATPFSHFWTCLLALTRYLPAGGCGAVAGLQTNTGRPPDSATERPIVIGARIQQTDFKLA